MTGTEDDTESGTSAAGEDGGAARLQRLSNGRYHVRVTDAGGGWSRWNDLP